MRPVERVLSDREVGERIRHLRKLHGYTQLELAILVGVSKNSVSNWEKGEYSPCVSNICTLSTILDVHPFYFILDSDAYDMDPDREEENKE